MSFLLFDWTLAHSRLHSPALLFAQKKHRGIGLGEFYILEFFFLHRFPFIARDEKKIQFHAFVTVATLSRKTGWQRWTTGSKCLFTRSTKSSPILFASSVRESTTSWWIKSHEQKAWEMPASLQVRFAGISSVINEKLLAPAGSGFMEQKKLLMKSTFDSAYLLRTQAPLFNATRFNALARTASRSSARSLSRYQTQRED